MTGIYKTAEGREQVKQAYRKFLARWPVPSRQFHVATRQGDTFVIACGPESAPPLVLLHGALANSASWMADVARWSENFRVFAVDVIGEPGLSGESRPPLDSDAYAEWIEDVLGALGLDRVSLVGVSLGGWLAVDFATRRPECVDRMALVCPGGIGKQKIGILFKIAFFNLFGAWGKRRLRESILGSAPADIPAPARAFGEFFALMHRHTRPRRERLPVFEDQALQKLTMPVLAIVGGRDALLDSADTRQRIEKLMPRGEVRYLEDAGHFIPGQSIVIVEFLSRRITTSLFVREPQELVRICHL